MMHLYTHLASLLLSALPTTLPAPDSILDVVPESCNTFAYCESPARLRERAVENAWFLLMNSKAGDDMIEEFSSEYQDEAGLHLEDLYPIANALRDESVLFATPTVVGLFTQAPEPRAELRKALNNWLPEESADRPRKRLQMGLAAVELIAWPANGIRQGHFAAFIEHPSGMGLMSGDDLESLSAALADAVARLGTGRSSTVLDGFLEARKTAQSTRGIEFYVNLSASAAEAERNLKQMAEGAFPDPTGMLGLEKDVWLHGNFDLHPGRRVDSYGFLHIPRETLLAQLADTFTPLPADLPTRLPRDLECLWALQWDLGQFYQRTRKGLIERHGEESLGQVDAGLDAAKQMVGVDPIEDLIASLDGTLSFYCAQSDAADTDDRFVESFGLMLGLQNSQKFLAGCEALIDATMSTLFDLEDVEGAEIYTVIKKEARGLFPKVSPGGIAFTAREFLLSLNGDLLRSHVDAVLQKPDSNLAMHGQMGILLDEFRGANYFAAARLGWLYEVSRDQSPDDGPLHGALKPFLEAFAISHAQRTPDGFTFGLEVR